MTYPKTIDELRMWAEDNNLPLADMRTYIGMDYRGAKAYGIYKDEETGKFIVYKNKADGTRSVRYEGYDQAYAVNELYMKMQERIEQQKQGNYYQSYAPEQNNYNHPSRGGRSPFGRLVFFVSVMTILMVVMITVAAFYMMRRNYHKGPTSGYYRYDDTYYYCQDNDFYYYDYYDNSWYYANDVDNELIDNYSDYYESSGYYDSYDIMDFQDSSYYHPNDYNNNYNNDYDNDWDDDWDNDWDNDWNDSYDDWDSDW
ncbi:MAG: hypothetical protein K2G45_11175 [Lachnospiraceae bacterium]|nr:hypothetical protein [Lachnospiraceae bacterium]